MFKPNRVGTPNIFDPNDQGTITDAVLFEESDFMVENAPVNIINVSPLSNFGSAALLWNGTNDAITTQKRIMIGAQFVIQPPNLNLQNVVGLELISTITIAADNAGRLTPYLARMEDDPTPLTDPLQVMNIDTNCWPYNLANQSGGFTSNVFSHGAVISALSLSCISQVVVRDDSKQFQNIFSFGWSIYNQGASNINLAAFEMTAAIRQLNDQEFIQYRDTLR